MEVIEVEKGTKSSLVHAMRRACPVCGAAPGEYCEDKEVPDELKPGWHKEREGEPDAKEAKN
jgi:hypothetical protein